MSRNKLKKFYDTLESQGVEIVEDFGDIALDDIEFTQEEKTEKMKIWNLLSAQKVLQLMTR